MATERALLHSTKRSRPRDISTLTAEEQELELDFTTYDYTKPTRDLRGNPITHEPAGALVRMHDMQSRFKSNVSLPDYEEEEEAI